MNILFVSHYSGFYGAAKSMLSLIIDLRSRYDVRPVVLMPSVGPLCEELDKEHIKYYVSHYYWWVNYNHGLFQKLLNKRKQFRNWLKLSSLVKLLKDEHIEIVYSNSVTVNIGMFLAERLGVPHIWQLRESLSQFNLSLSLSLSLSLWLFRRSINKRYILISEYMMEYYSKYLPKERMVRVYNGIDIPLSARRSNVVKGGILNLCIVGVVCEQKNQMDAVHAVKILRDRGCNNVHLYVAGVPKEDYLRKITDYISLNSLSDNVHLLGHTSNVGTLLEWMNIGLMCSRDEAFGRSTIEYMSHQMPVIASNSGANPELVIPGENGLIYEIYNPKQLADKIDMFLKKPEKLDEMGQIARKTVQVRFSVETNSDNIYGQIKEVLS